MKINLEAIKQAAFMDELEKIAEEGDKDKKKHPLRLAAGVAGGALLGSMIGKGVAKPVAFKLGKNALKIIGESKKINAKEFVKKHAPNVVHFDPKEFVSDIDAYGPLKERFRVVLKAGPAMQAEAGNAFYVPHKSLINRIFKLTKGPSILSSSEAPESVLAHEVGHSRDFAKNKFWRPQIIREYLAWKAAPKVDDPNFNKLKKSALGSYAAISAGHYGGGALGGAAVLTANKKKEK
jgi:hypothetical protein